MDLFCFDVCNAKIYGNKSKEDYNATKIFFHLQQNEMNNLLKATKVFYTSIHKARSYIAKHRI